MVSAPVRGKRKGKDEALSGAEAGKNFFWGKPAAASSVKEAKSLLREKFHAQRIRLSKKDVEEKSAKILENLFLLPEISRAKNVGCYISFNNEVFTRAIIDKLWKDGKKVFVPVMDSREKGFHFAQIKSFQGTKKNSYGILEPESVKIFPPEKIDAFIVPGLAFDLRGARIGWGQGFYDRFFSNAEIKGARIGIAFDFQLIEELPCAGHDAKMDLIVTEKRVVRA